MQMAAPANYEPQRAPGTTEPTKSANGSGAVTKDRPGPLKGLTWGCLLMEAIASDAGGHGRSLLRSWSGRADNTDMSVPERHLRALPVFPGGARPRPESSLRQYATRAFAVATIVGSSAYLGWRVGFTVELSAWFVAIPLLIAEFHSLLGLLLYTVQLWDIDVSPPDVGGAAPAGRVAVLLPTYNESAAVLLPAIAAAITLEPAHETWVLDDGHRPWVEMLAADLGAKYLSRPTNEHAKAGNLNYALDSIDADFVAILDADHVASPELLTKTLPYFADSSVAVVQTPQDFYNRDSFEHERGGGERPFSEEAVFYRVIAPGKNRWNAAFWCGTGALVRVAALQSVGGVAVDSVTEDIHTTIRLNRKGWKAVYHNEVLARGLAPTDYAQYALQRNRWATGAMQVLRLENPVFSPGLSFGQRLGFMTTLTGWFDSWRTLIYMLAPILVVLTGVSPIAAPGRVFVPLFLTTFIAQFVALRLLARGYYPPILSLVFEVLRMPAVIPATLTVFRRRRPSSFRVTPKGAATDDLRASVPRLLITLTAASVVSFVFFVATLLGFTPLRYGTPAAAIGAALFLCGNTALLVAAGRRIRDPRFSPNRRESHRFDVHLGGRLDGKLCRITDLSMTGCLAHVAGSPPASGAVANVDVSLPGESLRLVCVVRRVLAGPPPEIAVGLEFEPGQAVVLGRLAVALFNRGARTVSRIPESPGRESAA
jgi:cellulose synthase (UDP-forming)